MIYLGYNGIRLSRSNIPNNVLRICRAIFFAAVGFQAMELVISNISTFYEHIMEYVSNNLIFWVCPKVGDSPIASLDWL